MSRTRINSAIVFLASLFGGVMTAAQSISPPIAEYRGTSLSGMFEVKNTTDHSMAVVLEAKSFSVSEKGQVDYRPLDAGIKVHMGINSFVLRAQDSRMIFYKATLLMAPGSFSIIPTMTKAGPVTGVRVNYILPHMVYVYQKEKFSKSDIKIEVTDGVLHIQNLSNKLGRVEVMQVSKQELPGFPLYPGQTRHFPAGDNMSVTFEDGFKVLLP